VEIVEIAFKYSTRVLIVASYHHHMKEEKST